MDIAEILFIIAMVGGFLVPTALTKNWWLFRVFLIFFICFGLVEWWAVATTGLSVSQHFWEYSEANPTGAKVVLVGMAVGWAGLLWHLGAKLFKKKK